MLSREMRAEYDFDYSKAVRGRCYKRLLKEGSNVVVLEPDIAKAFPDSAAVSDALRVVLKAGESERALFVARRDRARKSLARDTSTLRSFPTARRDGAGASLVRGRE
ncbi:MAG: hypothetical protein BroJett031_23580 [Betaproteobacteria bacterium]|nr:MAG: hypothetical protein BroJett031_23580 [Betaproteobacteria bacterium]